VGAPMSRLLRSPRGARAGFRGRQALGCGADFGGGEREGGGAGAGAEVCVGAG
jgi:hypothetical protein